MDSGAWNRPALGLFPWIVASWLLALLAGATFWLLRRWGRPGHWLARLLEGPGWLIAPGELLLLAYALGPPYAALVGGFVQPAELGLAGFSWWRGLGRAALLVLGLLLLSAWAWGGYLRVVRPPAELLHRQRRLLAEPAGRPLLLLWAAAEELHWAFYRALPVMLWGPGLGLWLGLLLVAAERYALPQTLARLRRPGGIEEEAWWLAKALALTAAFAVLGNLWLCLLLHVLVEALVAGWVSRRVGPAAAPVAIETPAPTPLLLALGGALLLSLLLGWGALQPRPAAPQPDSVVIQSTARPVPTSTPRPTAWPTDSPPPVPPNTLTPRPTGSPTPWPTPVLPPTATLGVEAPVGLAGFIGPPPDLKEAP